MPHSLRPLRGSFAVALLCSLFALPGSVLAADQPNILVIWGDDIGMWNISRYSMGQMGYQTPNIDRIANEGMVFTDYYGEQSCTAGRSAFITGQHPVRTGLTKVGIPGSEIGIQPEDPTLAEMLKPLGRVVEGRVAGADHDHDVRLCRAVVLAYRHRCDHSCRFCDTA